MIFLSSWNMPKGVESLMDTCQCTLLLYSHSPSGILVPVLRALAIKRPELKQFSVPALRDLGKEHPSTSSYPYCRKWHDAADDMVLTAHTSGTTGEWATVSPGQLLFN